MKTKAMKKSQPKIHDSGYKKLFSNRTIFQQLIETFITEAWVKDLDFSQCETLDKSFITDHYKETESDLIYKLKLRRKTVYIYVLLEFQSKVDRFMVLRVLFYILSFYMDYTANYKRIKKLPAIYPIVLYNGKRKWSAPTSISDLIEDEPSLGAYAIDFQYLLLNEKAYSKEQLLTIRNIVSTLFLAEGHYDIALLEQELLNLYEQESDKQAVSLFLNWFRQLALYGKVSPDDYATLDTVYRTKEEVQTMLVATLEQERQKIYRKGQAEGEASGLAKGVEAQRQTLLQFIHWRFQTSEEEQKQVTEQLAQINDLQQLTQLSELFLQAATLDEFTKQVAAFLPSPVLNQR
ncbi:MAG: Rpn family recombination-promoting nuclease/putative transposase [Hyphomonadaceae bacterium]|nr:Rpn family recombination-promoting nuclease/putative transposase [Hyphomonadaceae bacterium]